MPRQAPGSNANTSKANRCLNASNTSKKVMPTCQGKPPKVTPTHVKPTYVWAQGTRARKKVTPTYASFDRMQCSAALLQAPYCTSFGNHWVRDRDHMLKIEPTLKLENEFAQPCAFVVSSDPIVHSQPNWSLFNVTWQKSPRIYQKSPRVCQKSPRTCQKSRRTCRKRLGFCQRVWQPIAFQV